ncbi:GatB/YqeY domain-containing protein [Thiotrichales bacterium 19S3-7]|nr:GatB/YqeY domain-containing protein [Thiotrichales bacterium 19S3-7]MCF6800982.1 GatB/YqeY domain-containing protein [Thiotrichales bacterium 19S3-11]
MSEIQAQLVQDMKTAMKNKDKDRLNTIRMALAALKQIEIDEKATITDELAISTLTKMIKQRNDSAKQYQQANRDELAEKELLEISILKQYLPQPLSESEINELIMHAIDSTGASSMKDMGKIMAIVRPQLLGRADMGMVSQLIKSKLG